MIISFSSFYILFLINYKHFVSFTSIFFRFVYISIYVHYTHIYVYINMMRTCIVKHNTFQLLFLFSYIVEEYFMNIFKLYRLKKSLYLFVRCRVALVRLKGLDDFLQKYQTQFLNSSNFNLDSLFTIQLYFTMKITKIKLRLLSIICH